MKRTLLRGVSLGILVAALYSCGSQDDSINANTNSDQPAKKSTSLSCEDLLNAPDDFAGKEITLKAISWGSNPSIDGEEILMSIDDSKLKGLQQAHILVHFTKDQKPDVENIKENDPITLTATVGTYERGALRLIDPKIKN